MDNWIVHRVEHLYSVYFMCGVVDIHLRGMQETELQVKWIVLLVNSVRGGVASEEGIQVIIRAICKTKKEFWLVPISFCETMVNREVEAF